MKKSIMRTIGIITLGIAVSAAQSNVYEPGAAENMHFTHAAQTDAVGDTDFIQAVTAENADSAQLYATGNAKDEKGQKLRFTMAAYEHKFQTAGGRVYKKISFEYPVAKGNSRAAQAFNQFYRNLRMKWIRDAKADLSDAKANVTQRKEDSWLYTDDVTAEITSSDEKYVSVLQTGYDYKLGAHGMPYRLSYIFDAQTGNKVSAADMLGISKSSLNTKVRELFLKKYDADKSAFNLSRSNLKKALNKIDFNDNKYYLKNGKLRFYLDPYTAAPGFVETAVKPEGNTLLKNASPQTSALAFYVYDGKTVTREFLFDTEKTQKALDALSAVKAEKAPKWSPKLVTYPVYGLEIGGLDGHEIQAAWSNGYWISQDGTAYRFDFDMKALKDGYDWTDPDTWQTGSVLPCARLLSQHEGSWIKEMLSPVREIKAPETVTAKLISKSGSKLKVAFTNEGSSEWCYGRMYTLQVQLDGVWYEAPPVPGNWGFESIACILPAGKTQEELYDLTMYGDLPAGSYRLETEGLTVEFEIAGR